MQTIETLRQLSPSEQVARLCECEDGELNEISCLLHKEFPEQYYFKPVEKGRGWWDAFYWHPSSDLNQAYQLANKACPTYTEMRVFGRPGFRRASYYPQRNAPNRIWDDLAQLIDVIVLEVKARTHARAVTILAIVGLINGGKP